MRRANWWRGTKCSSGFTSRVTRSMRRANRTQTSPGRRRGIGSRSGAWRARPRHRRRQAALARVALGSALLTDAMPGSTGAWFLPDAAQDRLVVADAFGPGAAALRGTSVPVGERLTGWVAARRRPIINSDAALDLGGRVDAVTPPLSRCLSVPLMAGDALVAVLTLYTSAPDGFTADDGRLVQMVAPDLARAIDAAVPIASAARDTVPPEEPGPRTLRLIA